MRFRNLLQRELQITLCARVTFIALAATALLVGHGFVLAIDLFSAASRSALGNVLMRREMDPLLGIVRPTLGGLDVASALLVPVIATRGLAIERERGSYGALALASQGIWRVLTAKGIAALAAAMLLLVPAFALVLLFTALGGHVDALETAVAFFGHALHIIALTAIAMAAAAGSRSVAQATALAMAVSLLSWAIDAGAGFAALSWIGSFEWLSLSRYLTPFERGELANDAVLAFVVLIITASAIASSLARIDRAIRRWLPAAGLMLLGLLSLRSTATLRGARDLSEHTRESLPASVASALRKIAGPISLVVYLDRDDGRRVQLERSVFRRLRLSRSDIAIDMPLDRKASPVEAERNDRYGQIIVHAGNETRITRSTSRKEIVTLIFEAAGASLPSWRYTTYPGYPVVIEGRSRTVATSIAYGALPIIVLITGWSVTRTRRRVA